MNQLALLVLMLAFFTPASIQAQVNLNHTWQPITTFTGSAKAPYGLTDLDNFPVGSYGYCKWGNLQKTGSLGIPGVLFHQFNFLTNAPYTYKSQDLFLNKGLSLLQLIPLPVDTWVDPVPWSATQASKLGSIAWIPSSGNESAMLFRKLHFSNTLTDEYTKSPITSIDTKLIVVIHGWDPDSGDPYGSSTSPSDRYSGIAFPALRTNLSNATKNTGWKVVFYNWAADADTGEAPASNMDVPGLLAAGTNATRAAEISHLHGQHLGELLAATTANQIQKIQFIAHSAGSWAARSAAKYVLANIPDAKVEITLLDPFIPSELPSIAGAGTSSLTKTQMDAINSFPGSNSYSLYLLENYYSKDIPATQTSFAWRAGIDINDLEVDWTDSLGRAWYNSHSGPVKFYADTITDPLLSRTLGLLDPAFKGWSVGVGWVHSMFYQEPQITAQITAQPPLSQTFTPGQTTTLTASAARRGDSSSAGITFQWQKLTPGNDPAASNAPWANDSSAPHSASYALAPVSLSMNGTYYRLLVSNAAGVDVSNPVMLSVGSVGGTVLAAPSNLVASAVSSSQVNLSWKNNASNATGFIVQRRTGQSGAFATITTNPAALSPTASIACFDQTVSPGTLYYYQVIATGTTNSAASSPPTPTTTLPATSTVRVLTVNSLNTTTGPYVYVGPNDVNGAADGNATFSRQFANNTDVTLVASATWAGSAFQKWQKDGVDCSLTTVTDVVMDSIHTMTAVYALPVTGGGGTSYNIGVFRHFSGLKV